MFFFLGGLLSSGGSSGYVKIRVDLQSADAITEFTLKFPNENEIETAIKSPKLVNSYKLVLPSNATFSEE